MSAINGVWGGFNRFIGALQRIFGRILFIILLVIVVVALIGALSGDDKPTIPERGALFWKPTGAIVEEAIQSSPNDAFTAALLGGGTPSQMVLHDVLDTLEKARKSDDISTLVINLNEFGGGSPSALHEVADALGAFRESGKEIIAFADGYYNSNYLLASQADTIYMNNFGMAEITGYSRYRIFLASFLERFNITANIFRVGTFKSAIAPFLRDDMSAEAAEANRAYMDVLWNEYQRVVDAGRGFEPGTLAALIETLPERASAGGIDLAQLSAESGLVDELLSRSALRDVLIERFGEDEDTKSFKFISFGDFASLAKEEKPKDDLIAIITAAGGIQDGDGDGGVTGGDAHAALIRDARLDENVKAIVLRVDSPGGGVFASELIRDELLAAKEQGLPIVVSMGGLAASGGYWISTPADEIWATPTTITGSIGVFGFIPTFEKAYAWAGANEDGVGTTALSNGVSVASGISEPYQQLIQASIEDVYTKFLTRVGEARNMTIEGVDAIAQGRVWAGTTALELGLVDKLGNLDDAIASAAEKAELEADSYSVKRMVKEPSDFAKFLQMMNSSVSVAPEPVIGGPVGAVLRDAASLNDQLAGMNDPEGRYILCIECDLLRDGDI
jgi:protease-4